MPVCPLEVSFRPITSERAQQRVAGVDQAEEAAVGVAEIGHGVERDVRHGPAEHEVEGEQVLERRRRQAVATLRTGAEQCCKKREPVSAR